MVAELPASGLEPAAAAATVVLRDGVASEPFDGVANLRFSKDGRHLAFAARRDGQWSFFLDGSARCGGWEAIAETALSDEASRYAIIARRARRWHLCSSDVVGPAWDSAAGLVISGDGAHVAAVVREGGRHRAVRDGVAGQPWDGVEWRSLRMNHAGSVGFIAQRGPQRHAVVDERVGPAFDEVSPVAFGEAGHFGYIGRGSAGSTVVIDGAPASTWDRATDLCFAPDGRRFAFLASRGGAGLAVVAGTPWAFPSLLEGSLVWSRDGDHFAVVAGDPGQRRLSVHVDGQRFVELDLGELAGSWMRRRLETAWPEQPTPLAAFVAAQLERALAPRPSPAGDAGAR